MEIELELTTLDPTLASQLLGTPNPVVDTEVEIIDRARLRFDGSERVRGGEEQLLFFVLSIPVGVATSIIASKLYDKLFKDRSHQIKRLRITITDTTRESKSGTKIRQRDIVVSGSGAKVIPQLEKFFTEVLESAE